MEGNCHTLSHIFVWNDLTAAHYTHRPVLPTAVDYNHTTFTPVSLRSPAVDCVLGSVGRGHVSELDIGLSGVGMWPDVRAGGRKDVGRCRQT